MKLWTAEEVELLKENYNIKSNENLKSLFPNKTFNAIYKKAYKMGLRKKDEITFINRSQSRKKGRKQYAISSGGYRLIYKPDHARADNNGYVFEHIVIWEKAHNKSVPEKCVIHHINGIKTDNRIENLLLLTREEHVVFHHANQKRSDETKKKISVKQTERLKDQRNHPMYKEIPIEILIRLVENGESVASVCKKYNICRYTYYKKLKERGN